MRKSVLAMTCLLFVLDGCGGTPAVPAFAPIGFADQPVMKVNAPRIEIQEDYVSPLSSPHVEHEMPVRPIELVRSWARDRLRPIGRSGEFRVIVKDASVIAEDLPTKGGITGVFTKQQSVNLVARLVVELDYQQPGLGANSATVKIFRTQTLEKDISLNDRDKAYYNLARQLAADLNTELESNINANMRDALM